ncbi:MAG: HAMP domain-containing protein, partial [Oscillospiraceae bacterium]
ANDDENDGLDIFPIEDSIIAADSEIYDGVTFSQLRKVRVLMDSDFSGNVTGIKDNGSDPRRIYMFDPFSAKTAEYPEAGFEIYKCVLVFLICAAAVFAAALLTGFLIRRLLAVRKVIVKQIMLVTAIIASVSVMLHFFLLDCMNNLVYSEAAAMFQDTLDYIELSIDSDQFRDSGLTEQQRELFRSYEYRATSDISNKSDFISRFIKTNFHICFVEIARLTDDGYKYEFYSNQLRGARVSYFITDEDRLERLTNMEKGVDIIGNSTELGTQWLESVRAVTDSSGKQVGFIQIGSENGPLDAQIHSYARVLTLFIMLFIIVIGVLFIVIMSGLLRPLKKLKKAVSEVADGKIGTTVSISSNDELQDVAASFSNMSRQLEKYFNNINVISKAYEKYLPKGFFRLMGKSSVLDVKPGDHSNAELTYLFIGIDRPSGRLSDEESFCALNAIYGVVSEVLGSTGGTIQSFSDKMITCIFIGGAAEAAESALTIQEKLGSRADIGAGINVSIQNSRSVIGVIGSGEAMKTVTVSPAIELQYFLRNIMSRFGLNFVITEEVLRELKAARLNITARRIGTVNELMGEQTRFDIMLYELIDGCPDEEKKLRQAALGSYERALAALDGGNTAEARAQLISVLRVNRDDLVARQLLSGISGESEVNYDERSKDRLEIPH